jgi:hypothetical protein
MDKLRKYGKQVWLATSDNTINNKLFSNSSDKILNLKDYLTETTYEKTEKSIKSSYIIKDFSKAHQEGIFQVLDSFEKDVWIPSSKFGTKIKNLFKDFSYKGKEYNSQTKLFKHLAEEGILEIEKRDTVDYFKLK